MKAHPWHSRWTVLAATVVVSLNVHAQASRHAMLKRAPPPATARPACGARAASSSAATNAQRQRARELAEAGRQAAISGDRTLAIAQLRQAATLDPSNAEVAYQLARDYETTGDRANAVKEYCRLLAIAPNSPDAADAHERVAAAGAVPSPAAPLFAAGVTAYDQGRLGEAESRFAAAIGVEPGWADTYYDRGIVRVAAGDRARAASDFENYLKLQPRAADRAQVTGWIESLRRTPPSPRTALGIGLLVPGGGQFYTQRPLRGAIVAAGATVGYGLAFRSYARTIMVPRAGTDPFGNPYAYTTSRRTTDRPDLVPGLVVAGGLTVSSALEAFLYARRVASEPARAVLSIAPTSDGLVARVTLPLR